MLWIWHRSHSTEIIFVYREPIDNIVLKTPSMTKWKTRSKEGENAITRWHAHYFGKWKFRCWIWFSSNYTSRKNLYNTAVRKIFYRYRIGSAQTVSNWLAWRNSFVTCLALSETNIAMVSLVTRYVIKKFPFAFPTFRGVWKLLFDDLNFSSWCVK